MCSLGARIHAWITMPHHTSLHQHYEQMRCWQILCMALQDAMRLIRHDVYSIANICVALSACLIPLLVRASIFITRCIKTLKQGQSW